MPVDDAYTKLLLHMDGVDGGTTFIDEAGSAVTPVGNVCTKTANATVDVTAGRTYYASSKYNNTLSPEKAFDNNTGTLWHAGANANNEWIAVDLGVGNECIITSVCMIPDAYGGNAQLKDFTMYGSNDSTNGADGTWTQLMTGQHVNSDTWQAFGFENSVAYRWAKLVCNSSWRPDFVGCALRELEIGTALFGTTSAYFDGAGDYLIIPLSDDLKFGSGDFTIDCRFRPTAQAQSSPVIFSNAQNTTTNGALSLYAGLPGTPTKYMVGICQNGSWSYPIISTSPIANETWTHLALVRHGNTLTLFVNGTAEGFISLSTDVNGVGSYFTIGIDGGLSALCSLKGNIDEFRVSKGIARWTANFTPPTAAYPPSSFLTSGTVRFSRQLPVMTEDPQSSSIGWTSDTPVGTSIVVSAAIGDSFPATEDYTEVFNAGEIPGLTALSSGKNLYINVVLSTTDVSKTPRLLSMSYAILEGAEEEKIVINLMEVDRLKYPIGDVNVSYNKAQGNLIGLGNVQVDSFVLTETPENVTPVFNPNDVEHISATLTATNTVTRIYYEDAKTGDEHISATLTTENILYHINDIPQ